MTTTGPSDTKRTGRAALRGLPSVDRVLAHQALAAVREALPSSLVTEAAREAIDAARRALLDGNSEQAPLDEIAGRAAENAWLTVAPGLRPVINATGVIIHTNLGRAPLSDAALDAIRQTAGYSNLEYDLARGERGSRYVHAIGILRRVVGCEDALVVNNNAAALVLALTCLCAGREAILSRGQSVEIGGGFRIPEIMKTSGARLVEVGTTNRTYAHDYADAITSESALIIRVHASNFRIVGFTTQSSVQELADLAHRHGLAMLDDIGSGALLDTTRYGLQAEPTPQASLGAGADLVLFSGDKLLGGPQCGVIVGRSHLIGQLKKHPLTRALRVDKLTLAALEATLLHYLKGEAAREVPVWQMLAASQEELRATAEEWAAHLRQAGITCKVVPGESTIGGGSLPGETLPTCLLSIPLTEATAGEMAASLRKQPTSIIARVERGALLLDPRTVLPHQEQTLLDGLRRILSRD
jgi:L-seryl-tRNA(Ser) seleniumtransferase